MKKMLPQPVYRLTIFLFIAIIFIANSGNPPNGRTGAPGDGRCSDCHGGNNFDGNVEIDGLPSTIMTGETVSLTVNVNNTDGNAVRAGFQVVALLDSDNSNAGDFSENSGDLGTQTSGGREYIEHRGAKNFSNNVASWTFEWTAPSEPGDVTLYAAGNIANGGGSSGDAIKFSSFTTSVEGEQSNPLMANIDKSNVTCNSESDGSATVTATGGTPPYTYDWSNGGSTTTISNLEAGTYSVTVSDGNADEVTIEVTITEPSEISVAGSVTDIACNGEMSGAINITVSGGSSNYNYDWSNGSGSQDIDGLGPGEYNVVVTDGNNCSVERSFTIQEPSELTSVVSTTDESSEGGLDGSATVEATGGTPPYNYAWSNNSMEQTITNLSPGTYSVTVTDANGCEIDMNFDIQAFECTFQADLATSDVMCFGENSGTATITINNEQTPVTYDWSTGATTSSVSDLVAGNYDVVVTDGSGCSLTFMFIISEPNELVLTVDQAIGNCPNDTSFLTAIAAGGTPGYTYLWSSGETTSTIPTLSTGLTTVSVIDAVGCMTSDTILVEANDTIPPIILAYDSLTVYLDTAGFAMLVIQHLDTGSFDNCNLDSIWLDQDLFDCLDLGSNTVLITAQDMSGNMASKSVRIWVADTIPPSAICPMTIFATSCEDTIDYEIPMAFDNCSVDSIELAEGLPSGSIFPVDSTKVSYNFYDASGNFHCCSFWVVVEDSFNVEIDSVVQSASGNGSIAVSVSGGTRPYRFSWNLLDSGEISTSEDINNLEPGAYILIVTDAKGCTYQTDAILIDETTNSIDLAVDENLRIYPNPVNDNLNINYSGEMVPVQLGVYSSIGKLFLKKSLLLTAATTMDVHQLPAGIYYLVLMTDEGIVNRKFLKQ